jgi:hypothetical protein
MKPYEAPKDDRVYDREDGTNHQKRHEEGIVRDVAVIGR